MTNRAPGEAIPASDIQSATPAPEAGNAVVPEEVRALAEQFVRRGWPEDDYAEQEGLLLEVIDLIMLDRSRRQPNEGAVVEALKAMVGAFDTPISRRQIDMDFANEARILARAALASAGEAR